jgi:hypothetical protein
MKHLVSHLLIVLATACPLCGDTILVQEDFEAPAGGLVDGWNGWAGNSGVVISKTTIDRGKSASWIGSVEWPYAAKRFSYSPRAGEQYELVATLNLSDAEGGYSDVRLVASDKTDGKHVAAQIDKGVLGFEQNGEYTDATGAASKSYIHVAQTAATMDIRLVVSDRSVGCYYRGHGEAAWQFAGTLPARNALAAYTHVMVIGRRVGGSVDSIRFTVKPADSREASEPAK